MILKNEHRMKYKYLHSHMPKLAQTWRYVFTSLLETLKLLGMGQATITAAAVALVHSNWVTENGNRTRAWLKESSLEVRWELGSQNEEG